MMSSAFWRLSPLMLIVVFCASAAAAGGPASRRNPQPLPFKPALAAGWAFADLDGDHKPDLAQARGTVTGVSK